MSSSAATQTVEQALQGLIQAGTTFDIDALDQIYHPSLQVLTLSPIGELHIADKQAFKTLFAEKLAIGEAPLNTWAQIHHIQADDHRAHVLVSRKVNLTGVDQKLTLSIDWLLENDRWQVTREVIFIQPNEPLKPV